MAVSLNTALGAYPITALAGTSYVPLAGGTMTGRILLDSTTSTGGIAGADFPSGAALIIRGGAIEFFNSGGSRTGLFASTGFRNNSAGEYGWSSSTDGAVASDLKIVRDAAATLAQRNGTTQQIFRIYNTYTDSSNGEWGSIGWSSNTLEIKANAIGTGSNRSMRIEAASAVLVGSTLASVYLYVGASHVVVVNSNSIEMRQPVVHSSYSQLTEMTAPSAPATNSVRIYAEDNGSGKTRLMALFATGAAQQLAIEP